MEWVVWRNREDEMRRGGGCLCKNTKEREKGDSQAQGEEGVEVGVVLS